MTYPTMETNRRSLSGRPVAANAGRSSGAGDVLGGGPRGLRVDREKAAADTDGATAQTVRRMCEYIAAGVADPVCHQAAAYAFTHFANSSANPRDICWGVWWYLKHCVKYRTDEATMFRIGEQGQYDLLIAPAVLVRMKEPAEDCDGFSMLCATLLTILGVDVAITTVAVDPRDPSRWSHVFCCAVLPSGEVMPLDASHGLYPGWMVPRDRVTRWQSWDLAGRAIELAPSQHQGLHGYMRNGLGADACTDFNIGCDLTGGSSSSPIPAPPASGSNWTGFLQGLIQQGVTLTGKILTPPTFQQQTTTNANGQVISTTVRSATPSTALTAAAGNSTNILLIGGAILAAVVLASAMGKKN